MARPDEDPTPISPEEFIRRRPEQSLDQGPAAGPDGAPETQEPVQGRETANDGGPSRARPHTGEEPAAPTGDRGAGGS
ncbi:MAG TPA: hypothetical protein VNT51_02160 [Miltoncostaeaceae bacterium]|jgi:hypothetical protein|nr:hypothetical protein [Miltoncostaeaceae bacterium]